MQGQASTNRMQVSFRVEDGSNSAKSSSSHGSNSAKNSSSRRRVTHAIEQLIRSRSKRGRQKAPPGGFGSRNRQEPVVALSGRFTQSSARYSPDIQRAVSLTTLMSRRARHFSSNTAMPTDHALSTRCADYTHFISHSWRDDRHLKWLALMYRFNLYPALLATHVACWLAMGLTAAGVLPIFKSNGMTEQLAIQFYRHRVSVWAHIFALPTFMVVLLNWHEARAIFERCGWIKTFRCFLDKLCICQDNDILRQQGIDSLGVFLQNSRTMLILWSPQYFSRLWCCFEVGVFLDIQRIEEHKRLEILPLFAAQYGFTLAAAMYLYTLSWQLLPLHLKSLAYVASAVLGLLCMFPLIAPLRKGNCSWAQSNQRLLHAKPNQRLRLPWQSHMPRQICANSSQPLASRRRNVLSSRTARWSWAPWKLCTLAAPLSLPTLRTLNSG